MSVHVRFVLCVIAIALLGTWGCNKTEYALELTPETDGLHRQLSIRPAERPEDTAGNSLPTDEVKSIAKIYGGNPELVDDWFKFKQSFAADMPDDIGGSGLYRKLETPLGDLSFYLERFRGSDDFAKSLDERRQAVDDIVDLISAWLQAEFGETLAAEVTPFVNGELRHDLHNLAIYCWHLGFESDLHEHEHWARLIQFLLERDYFESNLNGLPAMLRNFASEASATLVFEAWGRSFIERKLGKSDFADQFAQLLDPHRLEASWKTFAQSQGDFAELARVREIQAVGGTNVMAELLVRAFLPERTIYADASFEATIQVGAKPIYTNGRWDEVTKRVNWSRSLQARDAPGTPDVLYCVWVLPNLAYQEEYLGQVILTGERLAEFVLWYHGLTKPEQQKWNESLRTKGEPLHVRLSGFRRDVPGDFGRRGVELLTPN